MFPIFHSSLLLPYYKTLEHRENYLEPLLDVIKGQKKYKVEEVLDQQIYEWGKKKQYLIK